MYGAGEIDIGILYPVCHNFKNIEKLGRIQKKLKSICKGFANFTARQFVLLSNRCLRILLGKKKKIKFFSVVYRHTNVLCQKDKTR